MSDSMAIPEDRFQQFIRESPWRHDAVQRQLNQDVPPDVHSPENILHVVAVPILKEGSHSVGVKRQRASNVGKIANCQQAVDLILTNPGETYTANQLTWPLGMELYVPKEWLTDPEYAPLREETRIPDDLPFRTKWEIALGLIRRARDVDVAHACIGADSDFGDARDFRAQLRNWDEPYMLRVTPSELRVIPDATPIEPPDKYDDGGRTPKDPRYPAEGVTAASPGDLAEALEAAASDEDPDAAGADLGDGWASVLPDMEWTEESWTEGTKGRQAAQFARIRVRTVKSTFRRAITDETGWLLLQKRDGELKAWLCWGVDDWSLADLVLYAHQRWTIEHFHRETKQFLGLNEFQGRTWDGWHRHVTMVVLAYAFLSLERARRDGPTVERLPPVADMARATMREVLVQEHMKESEMDREQAEEVSAVSLRVLFGNTDD